MKYVFSRARKEEHSHYPSANCLFCSVKYAISNFVPSKVELHLKQQHSKYRFKSKKFFESQLSAFHTQQKNIKLQMMNTESKDLLLASFKMTHVVLKSKLP